MFNLGIFMIFSDIQKIFQSFFTPKIGKKKKKILVIKSNFT